MILHYSIENVIYIYIQRHVSIARIASSCLGNQLYIRGRVRCACVIRDAEVMTF